MSDRSPIDQASPFAASPVTTPTKSKATDLYENRSFEDLDPFHQHQNNDINNHHPQEQSDEKTNGTNGHHPETEQHPNGNKDDEHENGI